MRLENRGTLRGHGVLGVSTTPLALGAGLAVVVLGLSGVVYWRARDWNLMAVGEEWAAARGVPAPPPPLHPAQLRYLAEDLVRKRRSDFKLA